MGFDFLNQDSWEGGTTGDLAACGYTNSSFSDLHPTDLLFYGSPPSYDHVALYWAIAPS